MPICIEVVGVCDGCGKETEAVAAGADGKVTFRESREAVESEGFWVRQGVRTVFCSDCQRSGKHKEKE